MTNYQLAAQLAMIAPWDRSWSTTKVVEGVRDIVDQMVAYCGDEFVYFIQARSARLIKIGRSQDPYRRLAQLQLLSPVPLEVMATLPGGAELERSLHGQFEFLRSHGEWFFAATHLVDFISAATTHLPAIRRVS